MEINCRQYGQCRHLGVHFIYASEFHFYEALSRLKDEKSDLNLVVILLAFVVDTWHTINILKLIYFKIKVESLDTNVWFIFGYA